MAAQTATTASQFQQHRESAERGDSEAQYWTAHCYYFGEGVLHNRVEAVKWLKRAAQQNSGKAKFKLAHCYQTGDGVPQDPAESNRLFRESIPLLTAEAEQQQQQQKCDTESIYWLGLAYREGRGGIPQDEQQSMHWFAMAANQGHAVAQIWLAHGYEHGSNGLEQNRELAFEWYQQSARNGFNHGQFELGRCYQHGVGVSKDCLQALHWYHQAIENGYGWVQSEVDALQKEILFQRNKLLAHVRVSLKNESSSSSPPGCSWSPSNNNNNNKSTPASLGIWAHGLALLARQSNHPVGISPTFLVLNELVPDLIFSQAAATPSCPNK